MHEDDFVRSRRTNLENVADKNSVLLLRRGLKRSSNPTALRTCLQPCALIIHKGPEHHSGAQQRAMRLLKTNESGLSVQHFSDGADIPKYAILSHTWYSDEEEITFEECKLPTSSLRNRDGWQKIQGSKKAAVDDGLEYIWIGTMCIDKCSSTELAEAINSMYRYYRDAQVCYVYLNDMPDPIRLAGSPLELGQHSWIVANDFDSALRQAEDSALRS